MAHSALGRLLVRAEGCSFAVGLEALVVLLGLGALLLTAMPARRRLAEPVA